MKMYFPDIPRQDGAKLELLRVHSPVHSRELLLYVSVRCSRASWPLAASQGSPTACQYGCEAPGGVGIGIGVVIGALYYLATIIYADRDAMHSCDALACAKS